MVEGSDAKRQYEGLNDFQGPSGTEVMSTTQMAFWEPASMSTVGTTEQKQQF